MFHWSLLLILVISLSPSHASALPTQVQLGGAIVAAVEEDAEQEEDQQRLQMRGDVWQLLSEGLDLMKLERLLAEIGEGRGKYHKQRKMLKYLYPLLVGVLVAKIVLVPLILKMLTTISAMSFVMNKIALIAASFLALKWILAGSSDGKGTKGRTHLEIVHLPPALKAYHGAASWDDLSLSGSSFVDMQARQQLHKFIPVGGQKDSITLGMGGAVGGSGNMAGTTGYRHPQHNYESSYNSKPFL